MGPNLRTNSEYGALPLGKRANSLQSHRITGPIISPVPRYCHTCSCTMVSYTHSPFCLLTFCRRSWPFSSSRCQRTRSLLRPLEFHGSRSGMFAFSTLFFLFQLIYLDVFQATLSVCWMLVFRHIIKQTGGLDLCHRFK